MHAAPTLASVRSTLLHNFQRSAALQGLPAHEPSEIKLVGILFCHPKSGIGSTDLLPRLDAYDSRSSDHADFFCAGYGVYWQEKDYPDKVEAIKLGGLQWFYSADASESFRRELQSVSKWRYSGETDLILVVAVWNSQEACVRLDFNQSMVLVLERLVKRKAIESVPQFFEQIFRFSEDNKGRVSLSDFSNQKFFQNSWRGLFN
jgi:hypothetical protein